MTGRPVPARALDPGHRNPTFGLLLPVLLVGVGYAVCGAFAPPCDQPHLDQLGGYLGLAAQACSSAQ